MIKNKIVSAIKILICMAAGVIVGAGFLASFALASHSSFDPNLLIEDASFINKNSMSVADIQAFMNTYNSILKNYIIPLDAVPGDPDGQPGAGKSAAQHIWDEAQEHGISPRVILVTLKKEQGFFSGQDPSNFSLGQDYAIKWAMGYGVYTGSPYMDPNNANYSGGLGRQVANAVASFQTNYNKLDGGDCIVVGVEGLCRQGGESFQIQTFSWDSTSRTTITPKSKATTVLYRYTPYVYNGNHNFNLYLREWGWFESYRHTHDSQNAYPTLAPGFSYQFQVSVKNTGDSIWQRGVVSLGTDRPRDRIPGFIREDRVGGNPSGWLKENRVAMKEASVAPGGTATFEFWYTVPETMTSGLRREYFRLVADGITWMEDYGIYWDVTVISRADSFRAQFVSQNAYPSFKRNQAHQFEVKLKNTGIATWERGVVNLGTDRPRDRIPGFIREDKVSGHPSGWLKENRVQLVEESVAPGGIGTFRFWYTAPPDKEFGVFREYFRPVADDITWMDDWGIYWDVTVTP